MGCQPSKKASSTLSMGAASSADVPKEAPRLPDGSPDFVNLGFKRLYHGQVAPNIPRAEEVQAGLTSTGPILKTDGVLVQRGNFGSIWVRQLDDDSSVAAMIRVAKAAEVQLAAANPKFRGGFYISLSESRCGGLRELRDAGYDFYTHRDESDQVIPKSVADKLAGTNAVKGTLPEPELVYKRWVGEHNAIPAWATSIEGAAALIFSPPSGNDPHAPGDDLLLVWEHKCWRTVSGAVDKGELVVDTIRREIGEEVGLALDDSFAPLYLGGWQGVRARDGMINDHFSMFALRAASRDFTVDELEIVTTDGEAAAMWVPWRPLLEYWRIRGGPTNGKLNVDADEHLSKLLPPKRREVANNILVSLEIFSEGRALQMVKQLEKDQTVMLRIGADAHMSDRGLTFVVDCGSRHTEIHVLRAGREQGSVLELKTKRLRSDKGYNISLSRNVLQPAAARSRQARVSAFDDFLRQLSSSLVECGKREGDGSTVFVGATGGVRKLLEENVITSELCDQFGEALKKVCGTTSKFEVISGDDEAKCELRAARSIFSKTFQAGEHGRVDLFSGGGATCQFAFGTGRTETLKSVMLPTDDAQKKLMSASPGKLSETAASILSTYESKLREANLTQFDGSFLGISMHQDVANLAGFENEFLYPRDVLPKVDTLVTDLSERTGAGWQQALDRWGEKDAEKNWVILVAAGLRLRAIVAGQFSKNSRLFFARTAPDDEIAAGAKGVVWRDNASPSVSWPVGMKLVLDDEVSV